MEKYESLLIYLWNIVFLLSIYAKQQHIFYCIGALNWIIRVRRDSTGRPKYGCFKFMVLYWNISSSTSIQGFIQNVHKKHQRFKSCLLKGRDRLSDFLVAFFFCVAFGSSGINRPRNIFRLGSYSWYIRSSSSSISCRYSS